MQVATLIAQKPSGNPEEPTLFLCQECDGAPVPAVDSDKHATKHGAESVRVFLNAGAYQDWLHETKIRDSIGAK